MANDRVNSCSGNSPFNWLSVRVLLSGAMIVVAVLGGYFVLRTTPHNGQAQNPDSKYIPAPNFPKWTKPDLAIVISGEMHGYTRPCGCSEPQYGGLTRRYSFLQSLKAKGWPIVAVDLGDIAADPGPQTMLKYEMSMKALDLMGYKAIGLGKRELRMPLSEALTHYTLNNATPIPLAVNLAEAQKGGMYFKMNVRPYEVFAEAGFKVGVVGAVGQDIVDEVSNALPAQEKKNMRFLANPKMIPTALQNFSQQNVDISILLFQGFETKKGQRPAAEAHKCAEAMHKVHLSDGGIAPIHLLVCMLEGDDGEPPANFFTDPMAYPNTRIVSIGHKGKYVGVVGVWKKNGGFDFKYHLVPIGPEYAPKHGDSNPVLKLEEDYALDLKNKDMLAQFKHSPHPIQAERMQGRYEGSARCGDCHDDAYKVWKNSKHSHAFDALVDARLPSLRQFDGECVVCHTVGFKYTTGYYDPPAGANKKQIDRHNEKLKHVGCESCHGPGSEHANNPNNKALYDLINPFRPSANEKNLEGNPNRKQEYDALLKRRMTRINDSCQKCHDIENDVHWGHVPFAKKWEAVAHPTPRKKADD